MVAWNTPGKEDRLSTVLYDCEKRVQKEDIARARFAISRVR